MTIIEINQPLGNHAVGSRRGTIMGKKNHIRRGRPYDPAEAARKRAEQEGRARANSAAQRADPAQWGVNRAAMQLVANEDVHAVDAERGKVARVRRFDVFALLHSRDALPSSHLAAVRRLQNAIAILHATGGEVDYHRVDFGGVKANGLSGARLEAGAEAAAILAGCGERQGALLTALCVPEVVEGRRVNWRAVVERLAGEIDHRRQADTVRAVSAACCDAYVAWDNRARERAA